MLARQRLHIVGARLCLLRIGPGFVAILVARFQTPRVDCGEFGGLLKWLNANVYAIGDRLTAEEIVRAATGSGLDAGAYFRHVEAKFA